MHTLPSIQSLLPTRVQQPTPTADLLSRVADRIRIRIRAAGRRAAPTAHSLARHATLWIERPQGRRILCETGTLWLTHDGDPRDVVVEAGQVWHCTGSAPLAIHALTPSALHVE